MKLTKSAQNMFEVADETDEVSYEVSSKHVEVVG
ncbi:Uncharacterised protein [Streptococcus pneumoniae]|nr:Uncharacterised protein [Streptococcus pneumoniae]